MKEDKSKIIAKKCPDCGVLMHVDLIQDNNVRCSGCHVLWSVVPILKGVDLRCKPGKRARPSCECSFIG